MNERKKGSNQFRNHGGRFSGADQKDITVIFSVGVIHWHYRKFYVKSLSANLYYVLHDSLHF